MTNWRQRANCRDSDPSLFFPEDHPPESQAAATYYAVSVCSDCPVKAECLSAHLRERFGVFGGLTPDQRRNLHRSLNRPSRRKAVAA